MSIQINVKFQPAVLDGLMREWVWRDLRDVAWPGLEYRASGHSWPFVDRKRPEPRLQLNFSDGQVAALRLRAEERGIPVVEYIRRTLYAAAGLPYPYEAGEADAEPAALVALAPEPPKPIEVPAAARSGADVRLPRIDPSRFLAFLAEDRDSRWPLQPANQENNK